MKLICQLGFILAAMCLCGKLHSDGHPEFSSSKALNFSIQSWCDVIYRMNHSHNAIYIYVYVIYQVYNIILYRHMNHIEINQFPAQFPMTFTLLWGWTCCYGPGPSSNDPRAAPGHPAPWTVPWNLWASTCAEQWPAWIIEKASHENGQFAGGLRLLY